MSPRARIWTIVATVCAVAVGATVGIVALTRDEPAASTVDPPPLFLDLGVRDDARRATSVAPRGSTRTAGSTTPPDLRALRLAEAKIGAAFAAWPTRCRHSRRCPGQPRRCTSIVLATTGAEPPRAPSSRRRPRCSRTPYAVRADDFPPPKFAPGPALRAERSRPAALAHRSPAASSRSAHLADEGGEAPLRLATPAARQPVSARRVFDDAVRLAPDDPETLTAAAVSRFDKDEPAVAFSRLGPLTRRFPRARPCVSISACCWCGSATPRGRRAAPAGPRARPGNPLGREAKRFLDRL